MSGRGGSHIRNQRKHFESVSSVQIGVKPPPLSFAGPEANRVEAAEGSHQDAPPERWVKVRQYRRRRVLAEQEEVLKQRLANQHESVAEREYPAEEPDGERFSPTRRRRDGQRRFGGGVNVYMRLVVLGLVHGVAAPIRRLEEDNVEDEEDGDDYAGPEDRLLQETLRTVVGNGRDAVDQPRER